MFADIQWIKSSVGKLDKPLRKELLNCYRNTRYVPCFLKDFFNKIRYSLKKIKVIIRFTDQCACEYKQKVQKIIKFKEGRKSRKINILNCCSTKLSPKKINELLQSEHIKKIYLDAEVKALLNKACPSVNAPYAWKNNRTGKGIPTAVIDTGINPHDDLVKPTNRIIAFKDLVKNKTTPYDDNGHGTHVAGDIAGNGLCSNGLYKGPAYKSALIGIKALDKYGSGSLSDIITGIDWCIQNKDKYNIKILNLSLGAKAQVSYTEDLLCEAVEKAWDDGIVVCAAAGNEGPEYQTISSPGIDPKIITVGATEDKDTPDRTDDKIADFSSRGPTLDGFNKPDVVSPGKDIISLRVPNSYLDKQMKSSRVGKYYLTMSGTSMATPICCGLIALLLEDNPSLNPNQLKDLLIKTCHNMNYEQNIQGSGCIDAQKALVES